MTTHPDHSWQWACALCSCSFWWWIQKIFEASLEHHWQWLSVLLHMSYMLAAGVSRVCDVVYEEGRSWSGVNQTVLKIYGAKNHISLNQLIHCYPLREEPAQKEERSASILRHKFQKHPLTPQFCTAVLGPKCSFWVQFSFSKVHRNLRCYLLGLLWVTRNWEGVSQVFSLTFMSTWTRNLIGLQCYLGILIGQTTL